MQAWRLCVDGECWIYDRDMAKTQQANNWTIELPTKLTPGTHTLTIEGCTRYYEHVKYKDLQVRLVCSQPAVTTVAP